MPPNKTHSLPVTSQDKENLLYCDETIELKTTSTNATSEDVEMEDEASTALTDFH